MTPATGTVTVTGIRPFLRAATRTPVPPASVTLTATTPAIDADRTEVPAPGSMTAGGQAPAVEITFTVPAGSVVGTGRVPVPGHGYPVDDTGTIVQGNQGAFGKGFKTPSGGVLARGRQPHYLVVNRVPDGAAAFLGRILSAGVTIPVDIGRILVTGQVPPLTESRTDPAVLPVGVSSVDITGHAPGSLVPDRSRRFSVADSGRVADVASDPRMFTTTGNRRLILPRDRR